MGSPLVDKVRNILLKANKAVAGKYTYSSKERRNDSKELKKNLNNIEKNLGHTRMFNQIEPLVNSLSAELDKGDLAVRMTNVQNYCQTLYQYL